MYVKQARMMAGYNQWMNEKLYKVCSQLTDEERKRERGAFFNSIHGTLNHIILGDKIWMGRFRNIPFKVASLDEELFSDFEELHGERVVMDREITAWTGELTDNDLETTLEYTSFVNPARRCYPMWIAVTHFFNHQTHHRGQLTTLLSQCNVDYGVTDLIWLPEAQPEYNVM